MRSFSSSSWPFPVTLTISNVWEILNLRHLKSQGAHLGSKVLISKMEIGQPREGP